MGSDLQGLFAVEDMSLSREFHGSTLPPTLLPLGALMDLIPLGTLLPLLVLVVVQKNN